MTACPCEPKTAEAQRVYKGGRLVRPLRWHRASDRSYYADGALGRYTIQRQRPYRPKGILPRVLTTPDGKARSFEELEEAKAFASAYDEIVPGCAPGAPVPMPAGPAPAPPEEAPYLPYGLRREDLLERYTAARSRAPVEAMLPEASEPALHWQKKRGVEGTLRAGDGWEARGAWRDYAIHLRDNGAYALFFSNERRDSFRIVEQFSAMADAMKRAEKIDRDRGAREENPVAQDSSPSRCLPWVRLEVDEQRYRACMAIADRHGQIDGPNDLVPVLREAIGYDDQEIYCVAGLDTHLKLRALAEIGRGSRDRVPTSIPDTTRYALAFAHSYGAMGVVIAHVHPSGEARPSAADDDVTKSVQEACNATGLLFLDHLIVSPRGDSYSYRDHGRIKE